MKDLDKAIIAEYKGSTGAGSLYAALTGGMWNSKAPQETLFPYIVFHEINDSPEYMFGSEVMENTLYQFSVFDDSDAITTLHDIYTKLTTLFDDVTLTLDSYNTVQFVREFSVSEKIDDYWQYVIQYRGIFHKK